MAPHIFKDLLVFFCWKSLCLGFIDPLSGLHPKCLSVSMTTCAGLLTFAQRINHKWFPCIFFLVLFYRKEVPVWACFGH